jgi:hypothetical protein
MSWDVMVLNYHGAPPKDITLSSDEDGPDVLGPAESVRQAITNALPGVDWSDPTWGVYMGDGFTFEFNTGKDDSITAIMVHVRGGGNPIPVLLQFAVPNQWSLFDCSTSEFIDPNDPSQEGWVGFQAFRDQIVREYRGKDETQA